MGYIEQKRRNGKLNCSIYQTNLHYFSETLSNLKFLQVLIKQLNFFNSALLINPILRRPRINNLFNVEFVLHLQLFCMSPYRTIIRHFAKTSALAVPAIDLG